MSIYSSLMYNWHSFKAISMCSRRWTVNKLWYTLTMEYYSALKINELLAKGGSPHLQSQNSGDGSRRTGSSKPALVTWGPVPRWGAEREERQVHTPKWRRSFSKALCGACCMAPNTCHLGKAESASLLTGHRGPTVVCNESVWCCDQVVWPWSKSIEGTTSKW